MAHVDPTVLKEVQANVIEKLNKSGRLNKLKALIVAESMAAMNDTDGSDEFSPSPELLEAKTDSLVKFQIVGDWLRAMGLNHTFNLFQLEAGIEKKVLDAKKEVIGSGLGYKLDSGMGGSALAQIIARSKSGAVAPTAPTALAPTITKDVPAKKKGEENLYEINDWTEGGDFVRFNQIDGQQLNMWKNKKCNFYCYDAIDSIQMDDCEDCLLVAAPCEGSVFLRNCKNLTVYVACKQLRTRDCVGLKIHLFAMTDPIIESSYDIEFFPFNVKTPNALEKWKKSRLDPKCNRFIHIFDFTEDAKNLPPAPHYKMNFPNHGLKMIEFGGDKGKPEAPPEVIDLLEGRLDPARSSEETNASLCIKTGSGAWSGQYDPETAPKAQAPKNAPAKAGPTGVKATGPTGIPKAGPTGVSPTGIPVAKTATPMVVPDGVPKVESPMKASTKTNAPVPKNETNVKKDEPKKPTTTESAKPSGALARDSDSYSTFSESSDSDLGSSPAKQDDDDDDTF